MKVGSIVECVDNSKFVIHPIPKLKQPYTVIDIKEGYKYRMDGTLSDVKGVGIILGELTRSCGYEIKYFRELLPPMEIQEALDSSIPVLIEK